MPDVAATQAEWLARSMLVHTALFLYTLSKSIPGDILLVARNVLKQDLKYDVNMRAVVEMALDGLSPQVKEHFVEVCQMVVDSAGDHSNDVRIEFGEDDEHEKAALIGALLEKGCRLGEDYTEREDGSLVFPALVFAGHADVITKQLDQVEGEEACQERKGSSPTTDTPDEQLS